ncbi:MAG: hypothetical protein AB7H90_00840 [Alphaproteobacteria bacterium]
MRPRAAAPALTPALALALLGAAALTGCGALDPYPTVPSLVQPGQPEGVRVAVCYNGLAASRAAAQIEAQRACPAGTAAVPVATDYILDYCPLLLPAHLTFVCAPGG